MVRVGGASVEAIDGITQVCGVKVRNVLQAKRQLVHGLRIGTEQCWVRFFGVDFFQQQTGVGGLLRRIDTLVEQMDLPKGIYNRKYLFIENNGLNLPAALC